LEEVDALTDWAHSFKAKVIACVNPMSLALLKAPGEWGQEGADIVCGEGQPLGVPLASGGPYYGFLACRQALIRQLPGRLAGKTVDVDGVEGFTLTLQAREQHIRRSRATSNICTNQGLLVTASTIYMSLLGERGLKEVAKTCHVNTAYLSKELQSIDGLKQPFSAPFFHEVVIQFDGPLDKLYEALDLKGYSAGLKLKPYFDTLQDCILICVTETKSRTELDDFVQAVKESVQQCSL
jgi:glycine dehydrogenase subunit 1